MVVVPPVRNCRLPANRSVERRRRAAIGHVRGLDAGGVEEELGAEMDQPARSARPVGELAGLALAELDQLLERPGRQRGIDGEHGGLVGELADRHDVVQRIERRLVQDRIDRVAARDGEIGVAVGGCLDRGLGAEIAAGAGLVLDDHGLAEPRAHLLGDQPAGEVRAAARRERRHELDRPRRPGLGRGPAGDAQHRRGAEQAAAADHGAGHGTRISCNGTCCWAACMSVSPMPPWARGRGRVIFTALMRSKKPKVMMFWVGTL